MSDSEQAAEQAFDRHESFESVNSGYRISTTVFDSTATVEEHLDNVQYTVRIEVPTLDSVTTEGVGPTVHRDWLETLERRLRDAPKTTREPVELDEFSVDESGETVTVTYRFHWGNPTVAADVAKAFAEYVEGTYVEGIIPGYEYTDPVSGLLSNASQDGEGGTPL